MLIIVRNVPYREKHGLRLVVTNIETMDRVFILEANVTPGTPVGRNCTCRVNKLRLQKLWFHFQEYIFRSGGEMYNYVD